MEGSPGNVCVPRRRGRAFEAPQRRLAQGSFGSLGPGQSPGELRLQELRLQGLRAVLEIPFCFNCLFGFYVTVDMICS